MKRLLPVGPLLVLALAAPAWAQSTGTLTGKVTRVTEDGTPAENSIAVVYLEGVPFTPRPASEKPLIRQKDLAFEPELSVIQTGTSIEFPNEDKVFHNVFSVSKSARFDLGLYKNGASKTVTFNRPGTVDVFCNIHPQMVAKVKIVEGPYFTVSAADGSFTLPNLPPGTWPVIAWQPEGPEYRGTVTIDPGKTHHLSIQLTQGKKKRWHLRKDGTPYGRYK